VDGFKDEASVTEEEDCPNAIPVKAMQPRTRARIRDIVRITIRSPGIRQFLDNVGTDSLSAISRRAYFLRLDCKTAINEWPPT